MMPVSYADLIPAVPEPIYKYSQEGASMFRKMILLNFFFFFFSFDEMNDSEWSSSQSGFPNKKTS